MATVNLFSALVQVSVSHEDYSSLSVADTMALQEELRDFINDALNDFKLNANNSEITYGVELEISLNGKIKE